MVGKIFSIIRQTQMCITRYYVRATGIDISTIFPPQHRFKLQLILSSVASYSLYICYGKTIFKDSSSQQQYKHVLCFKKLISKERNPQRITTSKKSVSKQKIQIQVLIAAITFYLIFYFIFHSLVKAPTLSLFYIAIRKEKKKIPGLAI